MQRGILIDFLDFMLSDNWWIEGEKAWFCAGKINALFCVDLNSQQCKFVAQIPVEHVKAPAVYSYCIKYGEIVFCLPSFGIYIWCYDLKRNDWDRIEIENEYQTLMCLLTCTQNDNQVWFLNAGGNIFGVNFQSRIVEQTYHIPPYKNEINGEYILQQNKLYCVSEKKIYCIDISTSNIITYDVDGVKTGLLTICYDGTNFWLSGLQKEIYVWNPERGVVKEITEFPKQLGIYKFDSDASFLIDYDLDSNNAEEVLLYTTSIPLGRYIWYIPWQANYIVYIDRENFEVSLLEVEEEQETKESLNREITAKYALEYIRENRYIGLYSYKNHGIFEIDTIELDVKRKHYRLCSDAILPIAQILNGCAGKGLFSESREYERLFYRESIQSNSVGTRKQFQNIGSSIYRTLN